jgi:hypothetical protein
MILKCAKYGVILGGVAVLVGGLAFGKDLVSYVYSSAKSVRTAVKDAVPIEFDLQRARDMTEQIIPELHANILLIAQEEVEITALQADIDRSRQHLAEESTRVGKIRAQLEAQQVRYTFGNRQFTREQVTEDLARRFERLKEAQTILAGKVRLIETRQGSLAAAMQMLERTRDQKAQLENQIEMLAAKQRLVRSAAVGSRIEVDGSKLAQTSKLLAQIKKRLDVAERVLAHESDFVQVIEVSAINEQDLLAEVDEYFGAGSAQPAAKIELTRIDEPVEAAAAQ